MAAEDASSSIELLARIHAGDRQAFEDLYLRYRDRLLLTIRLRLSPALRVKLQSEDVLHSVVREVLEDVAGFEPRGDGALGRWLQACVLNKIRGKADYFAAAKRSGDQTLSEALLAQVPAAGGELRYVDDERYERLERGLAALPDDMRAVIVLRDLDGWSNAEAAAQLGRTPDATAKLHARALARLSQRIGAR
jgi:RNA polymerase sigma-70 factor (ECF subfamily)